MSAIKQIREASEYYETMKELHDLGMVSSEAVAKARRELNELRWERDNLYTNVQGNSLQAVTA